MSLSHTVYETERCVYLQASATRFLIKIQVYTVEKYSWLKHRYTQWKSTSVTVIVMPSNIDLENSLSSWHTLLEHSCVHNWMPVFSRGWLLPTGRSDVQWSQIQFNDSEPRVGGSSWGSFPVWQRLPNHSSNCTVMIFTGSTACYVAEKPPLQDTKAEDTATLPQLLHMWHDVCTGLSGSNGEPKYQIHQFGHTSTLLLPTFHNYKHFLVC